MNLYGIYPNPKCKCQKQITFTPRQFQPEGARVINKSQKTFKGTQTAWKKFLEPAINATAPDIGMTLAAKSNNPAVGQATTNILKSTGGCKVLPLTDMHGNRIKLRVM